MDFLKKIDILYVVTLVFLLVSSASNFLLSENIYWILCTLFIIITAVTRKSFGNKEIKFIIIFAVIYLAFVCLRDTLVNNLLPPFLLSDIGFLFKYLIISFAFVVTLKEKAIKYIVTVTVHLTVISFFFYFLQVIGLAKEIHDIPVVLNFPASYYQDEGYSNFLIFGVTLNRHDLTNSGFLWEPGAFGCFLTIALLLNFFQNKFTFDGKSVILLIGLITTFSTTTYLGLIIVLFLFYRVRIPKLNPRVLLIIPVVIALFVFVPFLGDKIAASYNSDTVDLTRLKILERFYHKQHGQIPLGRFSSMYFITDQFHEKLILGYSNKYDYVINKKNDVNISNGIYDFMARFGLVSLIYLFYCYLLFCYNYLRKPELLIYCGILLFIMSFGEPILILPISLIFLFLPFLALPEPGRARKTPDPLAAETGVR